MNTKSLKLLTLIVAFLPFFSMASSDKAGPDHSQWDRLLQKHVTDNGRVDYAGFKQDKALLDAYLAELASFPVESSWPREHKMAYWINAYNAFTIKLIVDNYPVNSIQDIHEGKPWDVKWITLGDKTYSLNNIENDVLRPKYKDARIHFAVNCAAKSCPPLLNKAFTGKKLEVQLDQQTRKFVNNTSYNKLSAEGPKISKIFEWYSGDFGDIQSYLNKYSKTKVRSNAPVSYREYDWALNN